MNKVQDRAQRIARADMYPGCCQNFYHSDGNNLSKGLTTRVDRGIVPTDDKSAASATVLRLTYAFGVSNSERLDTAMHQMRIKNLRWK